MTYFETTDANEVVFEGADCELGVFFVIGQEGKGEEVTDSCTGGEPGCRVYFLVAGVVEDNGLFGEVEAVAGFLLVKVTANLFIQHPAKRG